MPLSLEKDTNGQMVIKTPIKFLISVKVFSLVVTFFNRMSKSDHGSKCYGYLRIEKNSRTKVKHTCKTREHLFSIMVCHKISGISRSKALFKRQSGLGLVHGLKAYEETCHNA